MRHVGRDASSNEFALGFLGRLDLLHLPWVFVARVALNAVEEYLYPSFK